MPIEPNIYDDKILTHDRSTQEDPLVMYFIINKNLNMSPGKIGVQCAHAAQMLILRFQYLCIKGTDIEHDELINNTKKWLDSSFRKIVKKANSSQFEKIKEEHLCFVVKDAGLTEVEPGSETVLALWPIPKSKCPKLISKLRNL